MTQQQIQFQLLILYIEEIPNFNGNNSTLEVFIVHCGHLINRYINVRNRDDPLNTFLIKVIISKLRENVFTLVGSIPIIRD